MLVFGTQAYAWLHVAADCQESESAREGETNAFATDEVIICAEQCFRHRDSVMTQKNTKRSGASVPVATTPPRRFMTHLTLNQDLNRL